MLNACPNQKIPNSIMNINGSTAAASAISAPRVSPANRRSVLRMRSVISRNSLGSSPDLSSSIKHHRKRQRHPVRDFQRLRIVERNPLSGQAERDQRDQDVPDVANRLPRS